ncbi:ATP-dependent RNA helicase HrpA [Gayadomonas joobiniege]|uniref:ATP-dependent RNA helicase HrpA n=1 Tax=Gayadomonas joobiniege TaxID=1234606 RepID=UPI00036D5EC2
MFLSDLKSNSLALLKSVYPADYYLLRSRFFKIDKINNADKKASALEKWLTQVERSADYKKQRLANRPRPEYPDLPVSEKKQTIIDAIEQNQVVIIAGETGSGKTTQLPKLCLDAGRGLNGQIAHTQPRRLAARSVASRIAEELKTELGQDVGFKIRFSDQSSRDSYIKLMTDGILLAEIQQDRFLNQYDTIIIDEAHERSLNIDFILGYLKQLLPKRPELKLIITSATIDVERFSKHFNHAPVIEVSGRTYPVEVRYRPINDESNPDRDQLEAIYDAVNELSREGPGDILIFMNGEREIRDTAEGLNKLKLKSTEVLPLYARLSASEQNRVFAPHTGRRIVLATNVAETSLTVPGIRYVIDPGTARISRYSARTKVQRLPIENISQASANQRAGRCGRVAAGICIRLYEEDDFINRPEFTDPEILRTNLASVILQMHALGLGDIERFPFIQPPDNRAINDGILLLQEIGALNPEAKKQKASLTDAGRAVARLPVDPRLGKMVLTAHKLGCLYQVIIIVAGLSIQDPRERPADKKQAADEQHKRFDDKDSDFVSYLNLWNYLQDLADDNSRNQFRKICKNEFLNYLRIREWQDIVYQLTESTKELGWKLSEQEASYEQLHRALTSGLLSHIGQKDNQQGYLGARNSKFVIFPGSALSKTKAKWIIAAELVETSRLFARTVAKVEPQWIEDNAQHLVKRQYDEPHWEKKRGSVVAFEKQILYGLPIVLKRRVQYGKIDPAVSRQIFIREALVNQQINLKAEFLLHNQTLIESIETLEAKSRRRDILADDEELFAFYDERIAPHVVDTVSFKKWWQQQKDKTLLRMTEQDLMKHEANQVTATDFPDTWRQGNLTLPLEYVFEPSQSADGINLMIPLALLNQVEDQGFDWSVPGYRLELATALIKSLPKVLRKNFVPAPDFASAALAAINEQDASFTQALSHQLLRMTGVRLSDDDWDWQQVPQHLRINFKILNEQGEVIKVGKSLENIKAELQGKISDTLTQVAEKGIEREQITDWDFAKLEKEYSKKQAGYQIKAFPALVDDKNSVSIKLFDSQKQAQWSMLAGVTRLLYLNLPSPRSYLQDKLPNKAKLSLYFNPFGQIKDLIDDCVLATITDNLLTFEEIPRTEEAFKRAREQLRGELAERVLNVAIQVEKILTICHQINKKLKGKTSFDLVQAQAEIKHQVEQLVFKGFVTRFGVAKLKDIERYLQALLKRLEKLPVDPVRDRLNQAQFDKVAGDYKKRLAASLKSGPQDETLETLRWMLEEYKVSLFAQQLGTKIPISAKRITQYLHDAKKQGLL